jgi:hypothetical protein
LYFITFDTICPFVVLFTSVISPVSNPHIFQWISQYYCSLVPVLAHIERHYGLMIWTFWQNRGILFLCPRTYSNWTDRPSICSSSRLFVRDKPKSAS